MKPIKITLDNTAAIAAALKAVNGSATAHTFTLAQEILMLSDAAESACATFGLAKFERPGARYTAQSGELLAKAYNHVATATAVEIERRSSHWYLTRVTRCPLYPGSAPRDRLHVTQDQADAACKRLLATVTVMKTKEVVA